MKPLMRTIFVHWNGGKKVLDRMMHDFTQPLEQTGCYRTTLRTEEYYLLYELNHFMTEVVGLFCPTIVFCFTIII